MAENLVTLEELAATWGVAPEAVFELADDVESVRQGRHRFYRESALAVFSESKGLAIYEYSEEG